MSMAGREKAELEPQSNSSSLEMKDIEDWIQSFSKALEEIRAHQITSDRKMVTLNENFKKVHERFEEVNQAATKAINESKDTATKIEPALLELTKQMAAIRQKTDQFLDNQSSQLKKAVQDVENLERKMLSGFGDVVSRVKPTFKERLYLVAVIATSSLTFSLLFTLLLQLLFKKGS